MSATSYGARRGKKRRVSSAKDPETVSTGSHHQPEIGDELAVIADTGQFMAFTNIYHQNLIVGRLLFYLHLFKYLCRLNLLI